MVKIDEMIQGAWYEELLGAGPLSSLTWPNANLGELQRARDVVRRLANGFFGGYGNEVDGRRINRVIAEILLGRLRDPLVAFEPTAWSPVADVVVGTYGTIWSQAMAEQFPPTARMAELAPTDFCKNIKEMALRSSCSAEHRLFAFLAEEADAEALAWALQAENLCDLNFANLICCLIPGVDGVPAAELARNFWDEMGKGNVGLFHRNLRLDMMRAVGLATQNASENLSYCLPEEIEHFNAYALSSAIRSNSLRLVGMQFATEFLVPRQLSAVLQGWRRVGRTNADLGYLLEHYDGDLDHADGWAEKVICPSIAHNSLGQNEILIGVCQHLGILGRLYDRIFERLT